MFGRATTRFGIGPHSSLFKFHPLDDVKSLPLDSLLTCPLFLEVSHPTSISAELR